MYRTLQLVLAGLLAVVLGLSALSRRFPHIAWLQVFRYHRPPLSEAQPARWRQRTNVYVGLELILMGVVLPMGYAALTVMFFNEFTTAGMVLVGGGSLLLVGLGVTAIWRNRRP
jgi:hypothetical protein